MTAWIKYVKEYRAAHPNLTYKQALQEASASYQGKKTAHSELKGFAERAKKVVERKMERRKEASEFLGEMGKKALEKSEAAHKLSLEDELEKCKKERESLQEKLKRYEGMHMVPRHPRTPRKDINELSLVEQVKIVLEEGEDVLDDINPKRRSQIRSLWGQARKEGTNKGMKGELIPVLNRVTGKYERDPARSKKNTTGFNTHKEMQDFIRKRLLELAQEAETTPEIDITKIKLRKGRGRKRKNTDGGCM